MSGEQPADPYTHWRLRAETAEARVHELEFEVQRLNMEMQAYRQPGTAKEASAMLAVIDALQAEKRDRLAGREGSDTEAHKATNTRTTDSGGGASHD